jgi:hypothetical protein
VRDLNSARVDTAAMKTDVEVAVIRYSNRGCAGCRGVLRKHCGGHESTSVIV